MKKEDPRNLGAGPFPQDEKAQDSLESASKDERREADKLGHFVVSNQIQLDRLIFDKSVMDSASSSKEAGVEMAEIIKTVVFKDEEGRIYAVILRATKNIDTKVIKKAFKIKNLQLIAFDQVLAQVGYPAGGVPPFGFEAEFIIDSDLKDDEVVYAGGGTINSLIRINVSEILRVTKPMKMPVSK